MRLMMTSSVVGLLGVLVSLAALAMAFAYAIRPNERRLALMRPLSLAAIFGGLSMFTLGLTNVLVGIAATSSPTAETWRASAAGAAESMVGLFVAFGCLTLAWLLITLGQQRSGA